MNLLRNCELKFVCEVLKWRRFLIQDLSDLDLSDKESGEEDEQEWNDDPGPVVVNPFVTNTGLVRDVRGYSTINFFNLMFKDSNFDKIAEETNHYAQQAMETKPDPA